MRSHSQDASSSSSWNVATAPFVSQAIIAGDGYSYTAYSYQTVKTVAVSYSVRTDCFTDTGYSTSTTDMVTHLMLKRVGTDGSASDIDVQDFDQKTVSSATFNSGGSNYNVVTTGTLLSPREVQMITNSDQGIALGWKASTVCPAPSYGATNVCTPVTTYGFAATTGATVFSYDVPTATYPVLQAQDGAFYGNDDQGNMIRIMQSGQTLWKVPGDYPVIATADGGVIGYSGITYDSQGRATGQVVNAAATQSWTGRTYTDGDVKQIASPATAIASTFAIWAWGGPNTATPQQEFPQLLSCYPSDNLPGITPPACPGPRQKIYNAYKALAIQNPSNQAPAVLESNYDLIQKWVFSKLNSFGGNSYNAATFQGYLQQGFAPYDGTSSTAPITILLGPGSIGFNQVKSEFTDPNTRAETIPGKGSAHRVFQP